MNKHFITEIDKKIGEVIEVDQNVSGAYWGKFARIWIKIDNTRPLRRGLKVKIRGRSDDIWILIQMKGCPTSTIAGKLGHTKDECDDWQRVEEASSNDYGPWLLVGGAVDRGKGDYGDSKIDINPIRASLKNIGASRKKWKNVKGSNPKREQLIACNSTRIRNYTIPIFKNRTFLLKSRLSLMGGRK